MCQQQLWPNVISPILMDTVYLGFLPIWMWKSTPFFSLKVKFRVTLLATESFLCANRPAKANVPLTGLIF